MEKTKFLPFHLAAYAPALLAKLPRKARFTLYNAASGAFEVGTDSLAYAMSEGRKLGLPLIILP